MLYAVYQIVWRADYVLYGVMFLPMTRQRSRATARANAWPRRKDDVRKYVSRVFYLVLWKRWWKNSARLDQIGLAKRSERENIIKPRLGSRNYHRAGM